jgi:uracil-DNA glycosylase
MAQSLEELVHESWVPSLTSQRDTLTNIGAFLREESAAGRPWAPAGSNILRAFTQPLNDVRVLIVGQDPYPTAGHAVGLSFSVPADVHPLARSLQNIFRELTSDIGCAPPANGDLTPWTERGVLLLNRVLTVQVGHSGSHRGKGWEEFTEQAIRALAERQDSPLVAILWGRDAQSAAPFLPDIPVIASAHPSPMSADRGFFGSRPFSRANAFLSQLGSEPIDWSLPHPP